MRTDAGDLEVTPVQTIYLKRWLKETKSSKWWYPACKIIHATGGSMPDWLMKLVTNIQKGLVSLSD